MDSYQSQDQGTNQYPPHFKDKNKLRISMSYQFISVLLVLVIVGMLVIWKPWVKAPQVSDRTISVTGETTLQATPDEYVFYPSYDFTNADKQVALAALTKQSDTIITKLKSLGVTDAQIKTDSSGSQPYYAYNINSDNSTTYSLRLTVTVDSSSLAQKIQDYLTTTSPTGSVSPTANFSDAKQKSLQNQARDAATKDARAKAEQTAKNLGFKLGTVKAVTDGSGFGRPISYGLTADTASGVNTAAPTPTLAVQPGQNKLSYSVDVIYYIH